MNNIAGVDVKGLPIHEGDLVVVGENIHRGKSSPIIVPVVKQEWGYEPVCYFKPRTLTLITESNKHLLYEAGREYLVAGDQHD